MVKHTFPGKESKLLEFKSKPPKYETLIKTCVAFANASGGRIIIGIDDKTHEVIGINPTDREKIYNDFANSLYDSTSPNLVAQIYEQSYDGLSVLIIEIPMSPRKPYFIKSMGVQNGTYIRVGSSTRKASQEYIEDLVREAQRIHYDEEIVHTNIKVISKDLLHDFYGARVTSKRLLADKITALKPANKEEYCPTVSGTLMFSENPHHYIPEALIRCTWFKGIDGRHIIRTEDITGTIEQQAVNSFNIISHWLTTHFELQGVKLKNQLPIPVEALREAIMNALLHRKYSIPGAIKIAFFENRLEIFNPGCFPGLVDVNSLGDGTTYLRNPTLVRLAYHSKLVETRGTGIRLIYESCKKLGIKQPIYHEEGDFVKLVFYFEQDPTAYPNDEKAITAFIKLHHCVSAQQVADYLSVSRNTAIRKLNHLIELKKIQKLGNGPSVEYKLK